MTEDFLPHAHSAELSYVKFKFEKVFTYEMDIILKQHKHKIDEIFNKTSKNNLFCTFDEILKLMLSSGISELEKNDILWNFSMCQQSCVDEFMGSYVQMGLVEFYEFVARISLFLNEKRKEELFQSVESMINNLHPKNANRDPSC